jgi:Endoplasmic Reticulum Oxidoreductin 1 (ERO1)
MPSNDYYDTHTFPEGYTGYDGSLVWNFIHTKICFNDYKYDDDHWKADFNKAVSGLHSIISAQVVRGIHDRVVDGDEFADDEIWRDPVVEYQRRLSPTGETPLAIENLYFCCMILLTAIARAKDRYIAEGASGIVFPDNESMQYLQDVFDMSLFTEKSIISVATSKLQKHGTESNSELWQARMRSRDLLRIMNCVQCNKCRFHGKISTLGLITSFQIILGNDGQGCDIDDVHRVELAALMTALHKCTTAIKFCREMQQQQQQQQLVSSQPQ